MDKILDNIKPVMQAMHAGHLVLTPNHRTCVQLLDCYGQWRKAKGMPAVCLTPAIYPVDIWLRRQWAALGAESEGVCYSLLEPVQESMLWQTIIGDSRFGAGLVNKKATARAVQESWRLAHLWKLPFAEIGRLIQFQQHAKNQDDQGAFLSWVASFENFCARHALLSLSSLVEKVTALIPAMTAKLPGHVLFVGFRNPPPLYADLIRQLEATCSHSGHFVMPAFTPDVQVIACVDSEDESARAVNWAKAVVDADPQARIGIICPDLVQRADILQRLCNDIFHPGQVNTLARYPDSLFSIPVQQPLASTALVDTALGVLALNDVWVDTLAFCRLLRSPFLLAADSEGSARAALEFTLRDAGEIKSRLARIRELAAKKDRSCGCDTLATALMKLENLRRQAAKTMPAIGWCDLFENQLQAMGWPGERALNQEESSQFMAWSKTLKSFKQASHWHGRLSLGQALDKLHQLVAAVDHAAGNEMAPIQVLGPTEADGLVFSHTWMMGLTEQRWPVPVRPSPFIPLSLQRQAGVPGSDIRLVTQQAQQQLEQFRDHTVTGIRFSYPCLDEDVQIKPAGMLKKLASGVPDNPPDDAVSTWHPAVAAMGNSDATRILEDAVTVALVPDEPVRGGSSLIADQADCPFRAFARHRLNIDSLPSPSPGLPGNVLGSLLHEVLENFWRDLSGQQELLALDGAALEQLVSRSVSEALTRMARFHPHTMTQRFMELETRRLQSLLHTWLDEEKRRGAFTVLTREQRLQWQHAGLSLKLRIDRIDATADGNLVVIDYKSSKSSEIKWTDARQTEPQLMLYMLAVESAMARQVDGLFIAQVHVEESRYKGISADNEIYPKSLFSDKKQMPGDLTWQGLKQSWQQSMTAIANQFLAGYVAVDPKAVGSSCTWCDLGGFCRINDRVPV